MLSKSAASHNPPSDGCPPLARHDALTPQLAFPGRAQPDRRVRRSRKGPGCPQPSPCFFSGANRDRTGDLYNAIRAEPRLQMDIGKQIPGMLFCASHPFRPAAESAVDQPTACRFDFHGPIMHAASIGPSGNASNPCTFTTGSRSLEGKHCLVLGAGGFLGKALCERLCENGARVRALVRRSPPTLLSHLPITWTKGDFTDRSTLSNIVRGQDFIYHLAYDSIPETSNINPTADLLRNVEPTLGLLDLCCVEGVGKVIFASSGGTVYGVAQPEPAINENAPTNPISAYGVTKLTIEKYLALYKRLHNLDYHVLRISNPYGPGQSPHRRQGLVATILHRALTRQIGRAHV